MLSSPTFVIFAPFVFDFRPKDHAAVAPLHTPATASKRYANVLHERERSERADVNLSET